ncbi:transglycosylase domain-containing protein [Atopobacter phocae]|uniref:transglycosylase domain-containing protein n=1 Tax=Atopobacter phocae TaxID=136492 RepID=UPI00146FB72F|nr:transglycosylase domain-containing protein [Atopobacter phocae]
MIITLNHEKNNFNHFIHQIKRITNHSVVRNFQSGFNIAYDTIRNVSGSLLLFGILIGLFGTGIGLGYFVSVTKDEPAPTKEVLSKEINNLELASKMFYADDTPISTVRSDLIRDITNLENISDSVKKGIIAIEDDNFYKHHGVVPKAVIRALIQEATGIGGQVTGGSTITQQLIKQQLLTNEVTFKRKANEILLAYHLEKFFSKDKILESYLNVSPFGRNSNGQNIAGIESAALGIFGKHANEVTLPQAAFLVGLPQNPYVYTPYDQFGNKKEDLSAGINRMQTVLKRMLVEQSITQAEYDEASAYDISKDFIGPTSDQNTPMTYLYQAIKNETKEHLIKIKIKQQKLKSSELTDEQWAELDREVEMELANSGLKIKTTIDRNIYDAMQSTTQEVADSLGPTYTDYYVNEKTGVDESEPAPIQTGSVLIENKSGRILGFVAGRDFENNQLDHAFQTRRSPGSTIKPLLVYGPAINENLLYPASIVADTAIKYTQEDGTIWEPTNYGGQISNTFLTARKALTNSLNNPTTKIYMGLMEKNIAVNDYFKRMGITGINEAEFHNPALAIGGTKTGPTVAEQTSAFSTFGNDGKHKEMYLIDSIEDRQGNIIYQHEEKETDVFDPATNYIVVDMMRSVVSEGTASGLKNQLAFSNDIVGKTGTSEQFKDIWFIGLSPQVTLSSWIGYDNTHAPHFVDASDGYGNESQRNLRYWAALANAIERAKPNTFTDQSFKQPESVRTEKVVPLTGTAEGTVALNGFTFQVYGASATDLFKKDFGPIKPTFELSIGMNSDDVATFWRRLTTPPKNDKKDEEDKKEKEESNETDSSEE